MKTKALTIIFFAVMLSAATMASEQHRRVEIRIDADEGHDGQMQSFRFDSDEAVFDLDELQLGESRAYVDKDGNNLYVVRTEEGFDFDLNGKKISLPSFSEFGDITKMHSGDETHVIRQAHKVRIASGEDIEGMDLDIDLNFGDMDIHGLHEIEIVEEEVDVTN